MLNRHRVPTRRILGQAVNVVNAQGQAVQQLSAAAQAQQQATQTQQATLEAHDAAIQRLEAQLDAWRGQPFWTRVRWLVWGNR